MVDPNSEMTEVKVMLRLIAENWRGHITLKVTTGGIKQLGYNNDNRVMDK